MTQTTREPSDPNAPTASRGSTWLLVLGGALAALGLFRGPAHSQGGAQGGTGQIPGALSTVAFSSGNSSGSADSNDRMIAVTGVDLTGASVLFVIDTLEPHIAVYQASGGSASMQSIKLVAARRIDLDLRLDGFNDQSKHSYKDLEESFVDSGLLPEPPEKP